jgi:hypothetical protein
LRRRNVILGSNCLRFMGFIASRVASKADQRSWFRASLSLPKDQSGAADPVTARKSALEEEQPSTEWQTRARSNGRVSAELGRKRTDDFGTSGARKPPFIAREPSGRYPFAEDAQRRRRAIGRYLIRPGITRPFSDVGCRRLGAGQTGTFRGPRRSANSSHPLSTQGRWPAGV